MVKQAIIYVKCCANSFVLFRCIFYCVRLITVCCIYSFIFYYHIIWWNKVVQVVYINSETENAFHLGKWHRTAFSCVPCQAANSCYREDISSFSLVIKNASRCFSSLSTAPKMNRLQRAINGSRRRMLFPQDELAAKTSGVARNVNWGAPFPCPFPPLPFPF